MPKPRGELGKVQGVAEYLAKIAANLEKSGQPLWLWEPKRRRIIWANRAGREFWGSNSLFDLAARSFIPLGPEARAMAKTGTGLETTLTLPGGRVSAVLDIADIEIPEIGEARLVRLSRIQPAPRTRTSTHAAKLFQLAPIGLCLMDPQGQLLDENKAWGKLAGGPKRTLGSLAGEEAAARFLLSCITNGRAEIGIQVESRRLRLFGKRLDPSDGGMPLIYVRGEDVTVEHALEGLLTQLAQSAQATAPASSTLGRSENQNLLAARSGTLLRLQEPEAKSEPESSYISLLSQEMRNPLYAIIGFSEIMQQAHFGPLGNVRYEGYSRDIRLSAERLLALVNDLLDLARIDAGQLHLDYNEIALEPLIEECMRLLQPEAAKHSVTLEKAIPPELPTITADMRSLRQALLNLISNAVKFTGEGGQVSVSVEIAEDGDLVLSIADTGIGMSEEEVRLALEPFGQIKGATDKSNDGPGLGLPVAKALAEANRAAFQIASTPLRGTKIEIVFPPECVGALKPGSADASAATG